MNDETTARESIYGLVDPRDEHIFYVGRSTHPDVRLRQHCIAKTPVGIYIREMRAAGYDPRIEILEPDLPRRFSPHREHMWIRKMSKQEGTFFNRRCLPYPSQPHHLVYDRISGPGEWVTMTAAARHFMVSISKISNMIGSGEIQGRSTPRDERVVLVDLGEIRRIFESS